MSGLSGLPKNWNEFDLLEIDLKNSLMTQFLKSHFNMAGLIWVAGAIHIGAMYWKWIWNILFSPGSWFKTMKTIYILWSPTWTCFYICINPENISQINLVFLEFDNDEISGKLWLWLAPQVTLCPLCPKLLVRVQQPGDGDLGQNVNLNNLNLLFTHSRPFKAEKGNPRFQWNFAHSHVYTEYGKSCFITYVHRNSQYHLVKINVQYAKKLLWPWHHCIGSMRRICMTCKRLDCQYITPPNRKSFKD